MKPTFDLDDFFLSCKKVGETTLSLMGKEIDDVAAQKIAKALTDNKLGYLQTVRLQWNKIWAPGAAAIATALAQHPSVRILDLGHNEIGSQGAEAVANLLRVNRVLREVSLNDNNIDDEGANLLLQALHENYSLQTLHLQCNPIYDASVFEKIASLLARNVRTTRNAEYPQLCSSSSQPAAAGAGGTSQNADAGRRNYKGGKHARQQQPLDKRDSRAVAVVGIDEKLALENRNLRLEVETMRAAKENVQRMLEDSLSARIGLEKQVSVLEKDVASLERQVHNEKTKSVGVADAANRARHLQAENQGLRTTISMLRCTKREMLAEQEALSAQLATWSVSSSSACSQMDFAALMDLEDQLENSLKAVKNLRLQRLHRKLEEIQDTRKCKICFEVLVDTVLLPCRHYNLCTGCSEKVDRCPICNTLIQERIHTFE